MTQENYFEQELIFIEDHSQTTLSRGLNDFSTPESEILGIKIRLGNQPLVYNLNELLRKSGKDSILTRETKDRYLIVHSINALRTKGRAKIDELQYFAKSTKPFDLQTVDLFPKTRFNEILKANLVLNCALNLDGEVALDIPPVLASSLVANIIEIGANVKLQLSASADFIGKFTYSMQVPVVQSAGIGSNTCSWILNPDEKKTPLLGDQLLIQSVSVAKGTESITYKLSGTAKADRGIFWKQKELKTEEYDITVKLKER